MSPSVLPSVCPPVFEYRTAGGSASRSAFTAVLRRGLLLAGVLFTVAGCVAPPAPVARPEPAADRVHDVVVVGAGLSGLTAARDLARAQLDVVVLEASNRIGGRALTDTTLSHPVDLGAAWLHGADTNPLTALADWLGFSRRPTELAGPVFVGSRRLLPDEHAAFVAESAATDRRLEEARLAGIDRAVADFLPAASPYRELIAANLGPLESGAEAASTSSADSAAFQTDPDDLLAEGIGTFVARLGRDVAVRLDSPVTAIRYGRSGPAPVEIEIAGGRTVRARRVIVTVSTGVLAAGRIAFAPELPDWKWQAIRDLPMGLLNKVVFEFDGPVFPGEPDSAWTLYRRPATPDRPAETMAFVLKPLGANLAVGLFGGDHARRLEAEGDRAALAFATAALADMFGPETVARIRPAMTKVTRWGAHPWSLGAYSAARPGASRQHAALARPVGDTLFFAGEAAGPPEYNGSLAAAYVAGLQASRQVRASLRPSAPPPARPAPAAAAPR